MPVKAAVENCGEHRLVVYRYSGRNQPDVVLASVARALSQLAPAQSYREIVIFDRDTDLSDLDQKSLADLHGRVAALFRQRKLGSRMAVAVIDHSHDAKLILPLFNALSLASGGADLSFELFNDIEPALKRLGIPLEEGLKAIARAA